MSRHYTVPEAFAYEANTPEGLLTGSFEAGDVVDPTDEQVAYLDAYAVPAGLATATDDPEPEPEPAHNPAPADQPQEQSQ